MANKTVPVTTLKVRGEACMQLQEMADAGDRTLTAQLKRIIREAHGRFQQGGQA